MRRVVVTGMGAITPVGNDIDTMWANMLAGVNGVEKITSFDTSDLKVHLAGTVKNFEPENILKKRVKKARYLLSVRYCGSTAGCRRQRNSR